MKDVDFDAVRPYTDEEIRQSIPRILGDPGFQGMMNYLFDDVQNKQIQDDLKKVSNVNEFQRVLTLPAIERIVETTTDGIIDHGFESVDPNGHALIVANHRDIILDSSILGLTQLKKGLKVIQTTWGNNLMINQLIIDLGKANQMITVYREGSPKELLLNSQRLSQFMRYSMTELGNSIWIAQRKGRTKDGNDKTDVTILKMVSLSCEGDFVSCLQELNVTPLAISYEWEPCDAMKVREIYFSQQGNYVKQPGEDFNSIMGGVLAPKGGVCLSIGKPVNDQLESWRGEHHTHNEVLAAMASMVDEQIYRNYHLWPSNYLAYDLLQDTTIYAHHYTEQTNEELEKRYARTVEVTGENNDTIRKLFLELYAWPVINKLKVMGQDDTGQVITND